MFKKKGIERVLSDLKKYFAYLFDGRFQIVATKYDKEAFGNWIVVLHSEECGIRIHQDRGQIFILVAPHWASTSLAEVDHYFDLRLLAAFLEKNESIEFEADLQHIELQYKEMSRKLLLYYEQFVQLVNRTNFPEIEKELHQLRERILAKEFPELYGKNSKNSASN